MFILVNTVFLLLYGLDKHKAFHRGLKIRKISTILHLFSSHKGMLEVRSFFQVSGFQRGGDFVPQVTFGNIWRCFWLLVVTRGEVLLASSGWRPGVLLKLLRCTAQPRSRGLSGSTCHECQG